MATFAPRWHPANPVQHPPQGWAPPFQGAPPIPPGVNVLPAHWNAGFWQFNPNYNPQLARPNNINWVAGQAWNHLYNPQAFHQQQQQHSHNPYKRQPRAPSAEYLATQLSDNPLGLSNMIPAEELERQERQMQLDQEQNTDAAATTTPWIWTPRPLENDEPAELPETSDESATHAREHGSASTLYAQVRSGSSTTPLTRYSTEPIISPNQNKGTKPPWNATEPPPGPSVPRGPQIYASPPTSAQQTPERPNSTSYRPESFTSKGTLQPTFSSNIVRTPDHYLSPSPSRASHRPSASPHIYSSSSRSSSRGVSVDALSTQLNHLNTSTSPSPNPLSRHSSMPNPTTTSHHTNSNLTQSLTGEHLTDEPSSMDVLSPLIIPITPKSSSRSSLGRHSSVPTAITTSLDTIPETLSTSDQSSSRSRTPGNGTTSHRNSHQEPLSSPPGHSHSHSRSTSRPSSRPGSRPGSTHTSPYSVPHSGEPSPVSPPHSQGHSPHGAHFPGSISAGPSLASTSHTPQSSSSTKKSSNPQPPNEAVFPPLARIPVSTTNQTSTLYQHSAQRTSPPTNSYIYASPSHNQSHTHSYTSPPKSHSPPPQQSQKQKRRKGYWNRRGDHVTATGYIVYAPPEYVYPKDLDLYPDGKEGGYMDHLGNRTKWVDRPPLTLEGGYETVSVDFNVSLSTPRLNRATG